MSVVETSCMGSVGKCEIGDHVASMEAVCQCGTLFLQCCLCSFICKLFIGRHTPLHRMREWWGSLSVDDFVAARLGRRMTW